MSDKHFKDVVDAVSKVVDAAGVLVIVAGIAVAAVLFARAVVAATEDRELVYREFRQHVGKAILLGLEFLVAADIIRTVAVDPTFQGVGVLGVLVVIRTFLSFTLDVELEGRWPWQESGARRRSAS